MNAIIYCRVSSRDQVEGTSLESQEIACREYALKHQLNVSQVFIEEGESAKFADRTQLLNLLAYCKQRQHHVAFLIVLKIDRFARNVEDHFAIKGKLRTYGVQVVSVTEPIQADANGKLLETILAGFAQFDNDVRSFRTTQGLQQRLKDGIFPYHPPMGYLPPRQGRKTVPDQPDPTTFDHLQRAWKLLVTGAYTKSDIVRFLNGLGVRTIHGSPITKQLVDHIFKNPYYAGILRDRQSGTEYDGRHVAMVTREEFARVQIILGRRTNSHPHLRLNPVFPLRGTVRCPTCSEVMSSSFAKGRHERYPYYLCFRKGCPTRSRSYQMAAVHQEYSDFLRSHSIDGRLSTILVQDLSTLTSDDFQSARASERLRKEERQRIQARLQELVTMRSQQLISDVEFVRARDECRRQTLELEANPVRMPVALSREAWDNIVAGLSNLETTWTSAPISEQRALNGLFLPSGYEFHRIRTAEKGLLLKVSEVFQNRGSNVVPHIKTNLNRILDEFRKFLSLLERSNSKRSAA